MQQFWLNGNSVVFLELVAAKTNNDKEYSNSVVNRIIAKKIYNLLAADKRLKWLVLSDIENIVNYNL